MDKKGWTITSAGLVALLTAVAMNGDKVLQVVVGTWLFLLKLSETAPLGLSSFLLALALAITSRPFLLRYLPPMPCRQSRDFVVDLIALAIGFGVMFAQLRTLDGALLGILAGFAAPLLAKGIGALIGMWNRP
jgi:hypothetical protein